MKSSTVIYTSITNKIITALESGTRPWIKPWQSTSLPLRSNGIPYQGINTLILWLKSDETGFHSPS
jgi:antirestriction protein ArdC